MLWPVSYTLTVTSDSVNWRKAILEFFDFFFLIPLSFSLQILVRSSHAPPHLHIHWIYVLFLQDVGPAQPGSEEDWLAGLALFLPEVGIETALVQETLAKLRESGATEHQLRNSVTAAELKEMGILLGPRYATPDACNSRIVASHGP